MDISSRSWVLFTFQTLPWVKGIICIAGGFRPFPDLLLHLCGLLSARVLLYRSQKVKKRKLFLFGWGRGI